MRTSATGSTLRISADQIAANYVGGFTSLPSLELATMPQTHKENQEGLNEGYYSHCSFRSPTQAVPAEINPRSVLNRLFGKADLAGPDTNPARRTPLDRQMLDLVIGGAKDLRRNCPRTINTSSMNTSIACVPSNAASPPSNTAKKRRPWKRPASA